MISLPSLQKHWQKLWQSHAAWNFAGTLLSRGAYAVFGIVIARQVGPQQFGLYNTVLLYAMMFIAVLGGSLTTALTRTFAHQVTQPQTLRKTFTVIALLAALISSLIYITAPFLDAVLWKNEVDIQLIQLSAIFIFVSLLSNTCMGFLAAFEQFRSLALAQFTNAFCLGIACLLPLLGFSLNLTNAFIILIFATSISLFAMLIALYQFIKTSVREVTEPTAAASKSQQIWQAFAPLAIAALAVAPAHWLCITLLLHHSNASEVALYAVALQWFQAAALLPTALANVSLPKQTRLWIASQNQGDMNLVRKDLTQQIRRNSLIMLPILVLCCAASPLLVYLYKLPQSYATWVLMLGFATTFLLALQLPIANLFMAAGKFWWGLWMNFAWAVIYLGCALVMVQQQNFSNAFGTSIALVMAYLWQFGVSIITIRKYLFS